MLKIENPERNNELVIRYGILGLIVISLSFLVSPELFCQELRQRHPFLGQMVENTLKDGNEKNILRRAIDWIPEDTVGTVIGSLVVTFSRMQEKGRLPNKPHRQVVEIIEGWANHYSD